MRAKRIYTDLAAYLADTGVSQAAFAAKVGASQSVISRLVNGKQPHIDVALALKISRAASIPLESLITRQEAKAV